MPNYELRPPHQTSNIKHHTSSIGVLLVNLGTPDSPSVKDVRKYLLEFLMDEKVLDLPWLKRNLLVRGIIVPFRVANSAKMYQTIWTKDGSPLMFHSKNLQAKIQGTLGDNFVVELAMRYQNPSIRAGLKNLQTKNISKIIVLPLFPQYAEATSGSIKEKVLAEAKKLNPSQEIIFINDFYSNKKMIQAFCENAKKYDVTTFDHILISFHGLPEKHIKKADNHNNCLKENCCNSISDKNRFCYRAQCIATATLFAEKLFLPKEKFTVCFQSRLGKEPWLQPYASEAIQQLAEKGTKKVLVFCPSFVTDCLETLYEIGIEYTNEFKKFGGEELQLVESLNTNLLWVEAVKEMILNNQPSKSIICNL